MEYNPNECTITLDDNNIQINGIIRKDYRGNIILMNDSDNSIIFIPKHVNKTIDVCIV